MARVKDRQKALELRAQGKSYSQIKSIIHASKSTLNYWLKDYPLTPEKMRELRDWNTHRIESFRETMRLKREKRLGQFYKEQGALLLPLSKRDLFIAGLALYWGEGGKTKPNEASISNTNPAVIKLFMHWLIECFDVPKDKFRVKLHLYTDMDILNETEYWLKILGLSSNQSRKPYIKDSNQSGLTYKQQYRHGTCNLYFANARIAEKIFMALKALSDSYHAN